MKSPNNKVRGPTDQPRSHEANIGGVIVVDIAPDRRQTINAPTRATKRVREWDPPINESRRRRHHFDVVDKERRLTAIFENRSIRNL